MEKFVTEKSGAGAVQLVKTCAAAAVARSRVAIGVKILMVDELCGVEDNRRRVIK